MWRPTGARETLRLRPLVKAGRADAARIKRVPLVSAGAEPIVLFAGRPAAQRATDARAGIMALLFSKHTFQNVRFCNFTHETDVLSAEKPILSLRNLYRA